MKNKHTPHNMLNYVVYLFSRPWVFVPMLAFTFMPTAKVSEALESGAEFLRIDTDARAGAMSSAGTASAMGISAMSYNPAGIASMRRGEAVLSHSSWYLGASHDFAGAGFALPGGKGWKLGISFNRLSSGDIEGRGADRARSGGFSAYDQAASVALARRSGIYSVGGAVKYLESSIAGIRGSGYAVDLGLKRDLAGVPASVGLSVQNLGSGIKYISQRDDLPLSVSAGVMFMPVSGFMLNFDAKRYVYDKYTSYALGTEYALFGGPGDFAGLALRGGVIGGGGQRASGAFTAGAGIKVLNADLDYAISPEGELGAAQRITLKKKF